MSFWISRSEIQNFDAKNASILLFLCIIFMLPSILKHLALKNIKFNRFTIIWTIIF